MRSDFNFNRLEGKNTAMALIDAKAKAATADKAQKVEDAIKPGA